MFSLPIVMLLLGSLTSPVVLSVSLTGSADPKMGRHFQQDQYLEQSALIELVTAMQSDIGLIKAELKETKAELNQTKTELDKAKCALSESRNVLAQSLIQVFT